MDILQVMAGALTGFVVGVTGVGGGALMTPILLLVFGVAPATAVGTDLWFAAVTKLALIGVHHRRGLIDWPVVLRLLAGSLIASVVTLMLLHFMPAGAASSLLTPAIGIAIVMTAAGLLAHPWLLAAGWHEGRRSAALRRGQVPATIAAGAILGLLVTLTSVGAGALGAVCLLWLYPSRLPLPRMVATDVAHAMPLAVVAGLGHLWLGAVDGWLLRDLLAGSIPAALAGAAVASRLPQRWLRVALAVVLLAIGVKLVAGA